MKKLCMLLMAFPMATVTVAYADTTERERDARQAELDAACETARQKKIAVERSKHVKECVETGMRADQASCERFYADFGARVGSRPPLFYDLPECVTAHEFRNSYRSSDQ